jgi:hypothetical protein
VFSHEEIIEILTDCLEIDQVKNRPLGHWEMTRLDQRDMIYRDGARISGADR